MPTWTDRRSVLRATGAVLTLGATGCLGGPPPTTVTVAATDALTFEPMSITVARGGTVTWANTGQIDHTVTAYQNRIPANATYFASGGFDTEARARTNLTKGLIGPDEQYSHTFTVAGEYDYYCIPHEPANMTGTITVE